MPRYVHPQDRLRRTSRNVVTRLETIDGKIGILLDKEWDAMENKDMERLMAMRREIEAMINKYQG